VVKLSVNRSMKCLILFFLLLLFIFYISCNAENMDYYKGNCEILLSSGDLYSYDNNVLNLKFNIKSIIDKDIPNVNRVLFSNFYKNGILTVISETDNDTIYSEKLAIYYIDNNKKKPEEIMNFHGDAWGYFFLHGNILFYFFDELIAINLDECTIFYKNKLGKNNIYIRNIFVDIDLNICIFSSNDYYLKDYNKNFIITTLDNSKESKLFSGILLSVDIVNKCIYYIIQENDLYLYNYEIDCVEKIIFSNTLIDNDFILNRIYTTEHEKNIFCYTKKRSIFISKIIFPRNEAFLYDYSYFLTDLDDNHLNILEEIKFNFIKLTHEQIRNIRIVN